jgi:dTDP-L-rhamnose 4-epimerase
MCSAAAEGSSAPPGVMSKHVLITGGAGFIGSHLADQLLDRGYRVRVLDCLSPQVHGSGRQRPVYLHPDVELHVGDVRDAGAVDRALQGVDGVFHLAAAVGVGQSMYEVEHYVSVNAVGTAVLMEALARTEIERLVVASSMSIYGEGLYRDPDGRLVARAQRTREAMEAGRWEPHDEHGRGLEPVPTPEDKTPDLASVYALTKYDQERLCLLLGQAGGIPTVALRFFNAYGPRQALSNPYTGVLAIFAARLLNDRPPLVFEDGRQRRDFVSVHDVARACVLAYETVGIAGRTFNVGSGQPRDVLEVARAMARALGRDVEPEVVGKYRVGDIRHCFADVTAAARGLGYEPRVPFEHGLRELAEWLAGQTAEDRVSDASRELDARGLTISTTDGAERPVAACVPLPSHPEG